MARVLRMPGVAANATEAVLAEWLVEESGEFAATDVIATVETEKAAVDVEADAAGRVLKTLVPPGAQVEVGDPIAVLGDPGEHVADLDALLSSLGVAEATDVVVPERRDVPSDPESGAPVVEKDDQPAATNGRVFASPLARKIAKDHGLAVEEIAGTGPRGRILRRDVDAAVSRSRSGHGPGAAHAPLVEGGAHAPLVEGGPHAPLVEEGAHAPLVEEGARAPHAPLVEEGPHAPLVEEGAHAPHAPLVEEGALAPVTRPPEPATASYDEVPHSRIRRATARRLTESQQQVPHFYLRATVRAEALLALRAEINTGGASRISVNDLVLKAVAGAHQRVPEMNVTWTEDAVRRYHAVDVAVAVATERGLLTPVVRDVGASTVTAVAAAVRDLADRARAGKLRQDDLEGGSISVTNLGMYDVEEFAAIINPPHAAILAVGAIRDEAVVEDGAVLPAKVMGLTLSVDHRPVDGVVAARWLAVLTELLEHPARILA